MLYDFVVKLKRIKIKPTHKCTYSVQLADPGECVLPLGLQVEAGGLEGVRLLLHGTLHHLPETLGHCHAQVPGRHLCRLQHPVSARRV